MRGALHPGGRELLPTAPALLLRMGVPVEAAGREPYPALARQALDSLARYAAPVALVSETSWAELQALLAPDGAAPPSPVAQVAPRAERLFLFAATLGASVSTWIGALSEAGDLAAALALDTSASLMAEGQVRWLEEQLREREEDGVLAYSPGYCGWPLDGQRSLFAALRPGEIGMGLTESCLMLPAKSVSGVLVSGPREIHLFQPAYPCCRECATFRCRKRIQEVLAHGRQRV